jgi:hypothetical protein
MSFMALFTAMCMSMAISFASKMNRHIQNKLMCDSQEEPTGGQSGEPKDNNYLSINDKTCVGSDNTNK